MIILLIGPYVKICQIKFQINHLGNENMQKSRKKPRQKSKMRPWIDAHFISIEFRPNPLERLQKLYLSELNWIFQTIVVVLGNRFFCNSSNLLTNVTSKLRSNTWFCETCITQGCAFHKKLIMKLIILGTSDPWSTQQPSVIY